MRIRIQFFYLHHQNYGNLRPLACRRSGLHFEPPGLDFLSFWSLRMRIRIRLFNSNADPDPAPKIMRIHSIRILFCTGYGMVLKPSHATVPLTQLILLLLQIWEGVPPYSHPGFGFVTYHQSGGYPVSYVDNTTGTLSSLSSTTCSKAYHVFFYEFSPSPLMPY
jgi:hypothetical protein